MSYITDIQNTGEIKVIRAFWGNFEYTSIPQTPQYNEIVYVWGKSNKNYLKNLGYNTQLISVDPFDFRFSDPNYTFFHKLLALNKAKESYNKILFLDWDIKLTKNLDNNFFDYLNQKQFLCPLYFYNKNNFENIESNNSFISKKYNFLKNYSWDYENMYVLPNASWLYFNNNSDMIDNIYNNALTYDISTLVEEFSIFISINDNLENYITNFFPISVYNPYNGLLNNYIESIISPNYYFEL